MWSQCQHLAKCSSKWRNTQKYKSFNSSFKPSYFNFSHNKTLQINKHFTPEWNPTFNILSNKCNYSTQIVKNEENKSANNNDNYLFLLGFILSAIAFGLLSNRNENKKNAEEKEEKITMPKTEFKQNVIESNSEQYLIQFILTPKELETLKEETDFITSESININLKNEEEITLNFPTMEEIDRTIETLEKEYQLFHKFDSDDDENNEISDDIDNNNKYNNNDIDNNDNGNNTEYKLINTDIEDDDEIFTIETINRLFGEENDKSLIQKPSNECDSVDFICENPDHKHHRDYDFNTDSQFGEEDEDDIDDDDMSDWDEDLDEENSPSIMKKYNTGDYVPASVVPSSPKFGFNSVEYPYTDRMDEREYVEEKFKLQIELLKMQRWVKETGAKIVVILEGRDAAGKGGTIKRLTENLNPRGTRVVALDKPTDDEKSEWFFQRYVRHLPHGGEILFFDRSWYNRAGVELVMGFCTFQQYLQFMKSVPFFEEMLVNSGVYLIKFWFSVTREEQSKRFDERATHTLKQWKLSPMDLESRKRWDQYAVAKEIMFSHTDRTYSPWVIIRSNDKFRARLNAMKVLLSAIPYEGKDEELVSMIDTHIVGSPKRAYRYPVAKGVPLFTKSQVESIRKHLIIDGVQINYRPDPDDPPPETTPIHYWTPEELPPEPPLVRQKKKSHKSHSS